VCVCVCVCVCMYVCMYVCMCSFHVGIVEISRLKVTNVGWPTVA
jgi:hypothetical protein